MTLPRKRIILFCESTYKERVKSLLHLRLSALVIACLLKAPSHPSTSFPSPPLSILYSASPPQSSPSPPSFLSLILSPLVQRNDSDMLSALSEMGSVWALSGRRVLAAGAKCCLTRYWMFTSGQEGAEASSQGGGEAGR